MIKKLLLLIGFLLLTTIAYAWTGSDITCSLKYPKGGGGQTTVVYLPSADYGIVKNSAQEVDYHFSQLYDNRTDVDTDIQIWCEARASDICFTDTVQDHNSPDYSRLLSGVLLKQGQNSIKFWQRYVMILRAKDLSGKWAVDWGYIIFLPRGEE